MNCNSQVDQNGEGCTGWTRAQSWPGCHGVAHALEDTKLAESPVSFLGEGDNMLGHSDIPCPSGAGRPVAEKDHKCVNS